MSDLQVTYIPISEINAAKYNPRGITDEAMDALKASLISFGFVDPVIVNRRTNTLVGGHQRLKAAADLGHNTVPVVYVDLDEAKEKALNITLNSEKVSGYFDPNLLQALVEDIQVDIPDILIDLRIDELLMGYPVVAIDDGEIEDIDIVTDPKEACIIQIVCDNYTVFEKAVKRLGKKKMNWSELEKKLS